MTTTAELDVDFDGEPLALGRHDYIVPAMPMGEVRKLLALAREMDAAQRAEGDDQLLVMGRLAEPIADLLHASLTRNYPDLDRGFVGRALDLPTFQAALPLLMRVNGLAKGAEGKSTRQPTPPRSTGRRSTRG